MIFERIAFDDHEHQAIAIFARQQGMTLGEYLHSLALKLLPVPVDRNRGRVDTVGRRVKELHSMGLHDKHIAELLHMDVGVITSKRRRLGLTTNRITKTEIEETNGTRTETDTADR